jgi:hypothetical protein
MASIQKIRSSHVKNIAAEDYEGYEGLIWFDNFSGELRIWDNNTPGGRLIYNNGPGATNKLVNGAYELVLDASGNVTAPGAISAVGNITANYFVGNGSQLTGINVSTNKIFNGNSYANVATANGNVSIGAGGNVWTFGTNSDLTFPIGNSKIRNGYPGPAGASGTGDSWFVTSTDGGGVASPDGKQYIQVDNVGLFIGANYTANTGYGWEFGQDGNITLPTNTSSINYANGTPYGGTGNVTAGNITIQNQGNTLTTAVNTINFTGNGVVATNVGNVVTVNVSSGGGYIPGVFGLVIDGGTAPYASPDFIIDGGLAA